ncbi:MAG: RlmE family RNA methyltransferase [Proteobacteria bacterium]|nr:RlmE family RNA methyltransferase [Pseudomonadota bacterium]MBU4471266.1 RlmE family RNA methyltransferase [Pseudomonadota bacterium]MCG2753547.1 RlmE family RNA methyltransferase [Desulfobacteraceae bacterium]
MKYSTNKNNKWEDHYARKARQEKYPARSVYKLKEIQEKFKPIQKGQRILDLGCAPGSWLMYAAEEVGPSGKVVGIDIMPVTVTLPKNAMAYEADAFAMDDQAPFLGEIKYHLVMSDMAHSTTGNKHVDSARSYNLSEAAFFVARKALMTDGVFICKIFQGEDFERFMNLIKTGYTKYKLFRPKSTRKESREIYVIGFGKKDESPENGMETITGGNEYVGS